MCFTKHVKYVIHKQNKHRYNIDEYSCVMQCFMTDAFLLVEIIMNKPCTQESFTSVVKLIFGDCLHFRVIGNLF